MLHYRGAVKGVAVGVERWPVDGLIACAARPCGVPAVPEAGLVADQHFAGSEFVAGGAARRRVGDPLPGRGLHQLAQRDYPPSHLRIDFRQFVGDVE